MQPSRLSELLLLLLLQLEVHGVFHLGGSVNVACFESVDRILLHLLKTISHMHHGRAYSKPFAGFQRWRESG